MKIKLILKKAKSIRLFSKNEILAISITHHILHYHHVLTTIYIYDTHIHFIIDEEICE